MSEAIFLTGTDTGAGKTCVATALLRSWNACGKRAVGMKPVASGCVRSAEGWRNDDALQLQAASRPKPEYALVNPCALPAATAPQIAAALAGIRIETPALQEAFFALRAQADVVLVEGVGGWLAPLHESLDQADLARAFGIEDVILVVGLRLGCINHARLSERAILANGFRLRGWIASAVDPVLEHADEYFRHLSSAMRSPCLGRLPAFANAEAQQAWAANWRFVG